MQQERGRRLAVRAGDRGDLELVGRPPEELARRDSHRRPHVGDHGLRYARRDRMLDDQRRSACLHCLIGKVVPVDGRTRNAEEQRAGLHRTRVIGEVRNLDGRFADDLGWSEGL